MNPSVRYSPTSKHGGGSEDSRVKIEGVALVLPDFLRLLDKYGIPHGDESKIRSLLR